MIRQEELQLRVGQLCLLRAERGMISSPEDVRRLANSVQYGHYTLLKNTDDETIAYIAWARINRAAYQQVKKTAQAPKYEYEWDEGAITLLLDVFVRTGWEAFLPAFLRSEARRHRFICYLRDGSLKTLRKAAAAAHRRAADRLAQV